MKKFNLEEAKAGKPVRTREGNPARIICYDCDNAFANGRCIVALIKVPEGELLQSYYSDGTIYSDKTCNDDLFMATEKKEGWIFLYRNHQNQVVARSTVYNTKEEAVEAADIISGVLCYQKVEWEE